MYMTVTNKLRIALAILEQASGAEREQKYAVKLLEEAVEKLKEDFNNIDFDDDESDDGTKKRKRK